MFSLERESTHSASTPTNMAPHSSSERLHDDQLPEEERPAEQRKKQRKGGSSYWTRLVSRWIQNAAASENARKRVYATCAVLLVAYLGYRKRGVFVNKNRLRRNDYRSASMAPLSLLLSATDQGSVKRALLNQAQVFFQLNDGRWKRSNLPVGTNYEKELISALSKTSADVSALPEPLVGKLATPVLAALPFVYLAFVYRMMRNQFGGQEANASSKVVADRHRTTTFRDVAGLDSVLTEVREVVHYLQDPARYHRLGAAAPTGVLLYGPPGAGKTLLAQAMAGEAAVDCFLACSASDFVEMYVGRGAARVRSLFATARKQALQNARRRQNKSRWKQLLYELQAVTGIPVQAACSTSNQQTPCSAIIFIDELDALAKTRSMLGSNDEREQTLNQLLTEMEGFDQSKDVTVIIVAATNRADVLDPAALRRFDRQIHVGYPDAAGRMAILQVHARRVPIESTVDWKTLAEATDNFSGADLRNLVNEAALLAVREGSDKHVIQQKHLDHAARRIHDMKNSFHTTGSSLISPIRHGLR
jgi:cell division protease FtsH